MSRQRLAAALLAACLTTAAACSDASGPRAGEQVDDSFAPLAAASQAKLLAARQRWEAAGITHYRFTEQRTCFCSSTRPVRLEVQRKAAVPHHEAVVSLGYDDAGASVRVESPELYPTVDGLFDLIASSLENDVELLVSYHPEYGYPTKVDVEPSQHPVDGGVLYTVSKFEIVERQ